MSIKLHYVEQGHGMPLILLHGNEEDGSYFKHQISFFFLPLDASLRLIRGDMDFRPAALSRSPFANSPQTLTPS